MGLRATGKFLTDDERAKLEDLKRRAYKHDEAAAERELHETWRALAVKHGLPEPNFRNTNYSWHMQTGEIVQLGEDE